MEPPTADVVITRAGPDEWQRIRRLRLAALLDAPDAFGATHEAASQLPPTTWRERASDPARTTLIAVVDGADRGMALVAPGRTASELALYGMWVSPQSRYRGVGRQLVMASLRAAHRRGHDRLTLDVCDHNTGAIRLYESLGFEPTGHVGAFPPPREHITEHERARTTLVEEP